ncbi:MAG: iron-sulfur cluster binding protein [Bacteroidetes bacterium]|nr:iron-sulfur cluster binding protein [Bacteroidota bacterium]
MTSKHNHAEDLKAEARRLGFTHVGIARAESLATEGARLETWLANGFAGTMGWMARRAQERMDPGRVLPGVRSVIVVAMNYYTGAQHPAGEGKVSRYAWGDDYHDVMGPKLAELCRWLAERVPGSSSRWYVDTGPVLEKAWAQRAGIGWLGKHATVITTDHGSWVFLGVVLTTAAFEPDEAAVDRCGTCTRCIEACPTAAIVEPYVVDARRCIAYLTIEHRGALPAEFEHRLEGWIFGCDICQDVCPWNTKHSTETSEPAFQPREGMVQPDTAMLMDLDDTAFNKRFQGSPLQRTGIEGLRRNISAQKS